MISIVKDGNKSIIYGLSTDDKEDAFDAVTDKNDVVIFREMDTAKDYVFNEDEWYEFTEGGGGGGGGGGTWDVMGKNPTFIKNVLSEKVYLKDTSYATWTPSTTSSIMSQVTDIETYQTDFANYDYILFYRWKTHLEYTDPPSGADRITDIVYNNLYTLYGLATSYADMVADTFDTGLYYGFATRMGTFYIDSNGDNAYAGRANRGVYPSTSSPTVTASDITIKSVRIVAQCDSTELFTTEVAATVNQNTSYYEQTVALYRVDKGTSPAGFAAEDIRDIWLNGL